MTSLPSAYFLLYKANFLFGGENVAHVMNHQNSKKIRCIRGIVYREDYSYVLVLSVME